LIRAIRIIVDASIEDSDQSMVTPLQTRDFFSGVWTGTGEFRLHSMLRLFVPNQSVSYHGQTTWLADTLWKATEEFALSREGVRKRITYIQIIADDRLHMTCDDIPGGADIILHENGFRFTPYLFRSPFAGKHITVRCLDEAILDEEGVLHDQIQMYFGGILLASMNMSITIDRNTEGATVAGKPCAVP
jgi:hypothetical protein